MKRLADPHKLKDLLGIPFTDEQLAAIAAPLDRPVSVIAGAGSGKTAVMAARVVWLVGSGQVQPDQVLGLTFTRKATRELAERITRALESIGSGIPRVGKVAAAEAADDATLAPTVVTYDSFANTLVSEFGPRLGIESDSRMITDATRFQLAVTAVRRHANPDTALTGNVVTIAADILALESELSAHLVDPAEVLVSDGELSQKLASLTKDDLGAETTTLTGVIAKRAELIEIVQDYKAAKLAAGLVQFADITAAAARIAMRVPDAGAAMRDRFRIVLLDEYQDTSVAQKDMLLGLFEAGFAVTAVGDPCQAIYGWRGASVSNIKRFLHDFDLDTLTASHLTLRTNTRSDGVLLEAANLISAPLRASHPVAQLEPLPDRAGKGQVRIARLEHFDAEVEFVVEQVREAIDEGTPPGEIAVLTRAGAHLTTLCDALVAGGIRAEVVGLAGLLYVPEVADVIATLQVLADPAANPSLLRLLTGPRWDIGQRDLVLLGARARKIASDGQAGRLVEASPVLRAFERSDISDMVALTDALGDPGTELGFSAEAQRRFALIDAELAMLRGHVGEPLPDLVARIARVSGLDVELGAHPMAAGGRGRDALDAFLEIAATYRSPDGESTLDEFLGFLRYAEQHDRGMDQEQDEEVDNDPAAGSGRAVQLMTMHKSKGLEWDVVLTPFVYHGGFPNTDADGMWTSSPKVLPWPLRGDREDLPALQEVSAKGVKNLRAETSQRAGIEERRVAYVAFTRARHRLVVSGHAWGPKQKLERKVSAYLGELKAFAEVNASCEVIDWYSVPDGVTRNPHLSKQRPPPVRRDPTLRADLVAAAELVTLHRVTPPQRRADLTPDDTLVLDQWSRDAVALVEAERAARNAEIVVALPTTLSASQAMRVATEPEAFARDLYRPMPQRPSTAARRGTRFHEWVEEHFGVRAILDIDDLTGAADDSLGLDENLATLQEAFRSSEWAVAKPIALEAPFTLPIAGRVLIGRIDAVFAHEPDLLDPTTVHIVDWKTGTSTADPLQLAIYRLAWARAHGMDPADIRAGFVYVTTGTTTWCDDLPGEEGVGAALMGIH